LFSSLLDQYETVPTDHRHIRHLLYATYAFLSVQLSQWKLLKKIYSRLFIYFVVFHYIHRLSFRMLEMQLAL
jgi:hypothetical protein